MGSKMLATSGGAQYACDLQENPVRTTIRHFLANVRPLAAAAILVVPTVLASQAAPTPLRESAFFSIGAGAASVSASCGGCTINFLADRATGLSWHVMVGGSATDRLVIAGEFGGWTGNEPPVFRRSTALSVIFRGYFRPDGRLFVKGGAGAIRMLARDDDDETKTDGWLLHAGLGYDFPMGSNGLTVYATYQWSPSGTTWVNNFLSTTTSLPNIVQLGLAYSVF